MSEIKIELEYVINYIIYETAFSRLACSQVPFHLLTYPIELN